jgi:hypothetical protein
MLGNTMTIEKTTDYGKFTVLDGNRPIYKGHLNRLVNAIRENNMLRYSPILVNDKFEVIDGQHRLQAAKKLKLELYYQVIPAGNLSEVQLLNTNNRNWTTEDFLESYVKRGFKDYRYLRDFAEENNMSVSNAVGLLSGGFNHIEGNHDRMLTFRTGDFVATHKDYAVLMAKRLEEMDKYLEPSVRNDRDFLKGLEKAYKTIQHEDLMAKLIASGWKIDRHVTARDYLRRIEDIVNFKISKNRKRLF